MSLVLDSSATLAWIYGDETTDSIRELFDQVIDQGAIVPALWRLEVANSLTVAVRRSRIEVEFRCAALADLAHLDISTDGHTDGHTWSDTLHLADRFRLSLYDAAYLSRTRAAPNAATGHTGSRTARGRASGWHSNLGRAMTGESTSPVLSSDWRLPKDRESGSGASVQGRGSISLLLPASITPIRHRNPFQSQAWFC